MRSLSIIFYYFFQNQKKMITAKGQRWSNPLWYARRIPLLQDIAEAICVRIRPTGWLPRASWWTSQYVTLSKVWCQEPNQEPWFGMHAISDASFDSASIRHITKPYSINITSDFLAYGMESLLVCFNHAPLQGVAGEFSYPKHLDGFQLTWPPAAVPLNSILTSGAFDALFVRISHYNSA